jgi:hypothetical protein
VRGACPGWEVPMCITDKFEMGVKVVTSQAVETVPVCRIRPASSYSVE